MNQIYYAYFFTRQDLSPEQQAVQTAHAAFKLGVKIKDKKVNEDSDITDVPFIRNPDPDQTYFTLVGVRNLDGLDAVAKILQKFGFKYEVFVEPDIGMEATSIAVYPVPENERGPLLAFNLLKMKV